MEIHDQPSNLQTLIIELERRYSNFRKIDIFKAVSHAYKKIFSGFSNLTENELEEIKNLAVSDLNS
jgi:hypothetical protein